MEIVLLINNTLPGVNQPSYGYIGLTDPEGNAPACISVPVIHYPTYSFIFTDRETPYNFNFYVTVLIIS